MLSLSKQDYWQAQGRVPFQSQARVKSEKRKENFASGLSLKSYEQRHFYRVCVVVPGPVGNPESYPVQSL